MVIIDKSKPVLVTGVTGYVASWLVKKLLENGLTVHAAVRNPLDQSKIKHLEKAAQESGGKIIYFKTDLLTIDSYADAMEGCEVVFHTASPFSTNVKNPQTDLVDPAVKGTENVLNTANKTKSVKKIVLTSSVAAMYTDAIDCEKAPSGKLNEDIWNTTSSIEYQPYSYSKTMAERKAWILKEAQSRWELVTINPSLVLGPMLNPGATTSESFNILKQMGDGTMRFGVPKMGIGLVDVRDVAEAHFQAGFNPIAKGRYLTSGHNTDFFEMSSALLSKFEEKYPLPTRTIPKWLMLIIGPLTNKIFTPRYVRNNVNVAWRADNSKIKKDFGITFRPLKETMEDSFQVLVDAGIFKK